MDIKIKDAQGTYQTYTGIDKVQFTKTDNTIGVFNDVSDTTAQASDVEQGKYFYASDGTKVAGIKVTTPGFEKVHITQTINGDTCTLAIVPYTSQTDNNYYLVPVEGTNNQQFYLVDIIQQ